MLVNVLEAKTNLSNLIRMVEDGREESVVITRYGKPIVTMTAYDHGDNKRRVGVAAGKLKYPADIHAFDDEVTEMMEGSTL